MPDFAAPASGGCLAFDFGETRIGAAQGDCRIRIAHPIATITGNSNDEKFARIAALIQEWQPENLIVGLPVHIDGSEHALTRQIRASPERAFQAARVLGGRTAIVGLRRRAVARKRRSRAQTKARAGPSCRASHFAKFF